MMGKKHRLNTTRTQQTQGPAPGKHTSSQTDTHGNGNIMDGKRIL